MKEKDFNILEVKGQTRNLYVLFDKVTEMCGPVFEQVNDMAARRAVNNMKFPTEESKDDYVLLRVGSISQMGDIFNCEKLIINIRGEENG